MVTVAVSVVVATIPGVAAASVTAADAGDPLAAASATVVASAAEAGLPGVASATAAVSAAEVGLPGAVSAAEVVLLGEGEVTPANFSSGSTETGTASSTRKSRKARPDS